MQTNTIIQKPALHDAGISFVGVKAIRPAGRADVYNMEVAQYHNFSVNGGVIVHNCMDAMRYALEDFMRGDTFSFK